LAILIFTTATSAVVFAASTSLVDAVRRGDADAVQTALASKSVDVNAVAADGSTALDNAVTNSVAAGVVYSIAAGNSSART